MLGVARGRAHLVNVVDRPLPKGKTEVGRIQAVLVPLIESVEVPWEAERVESYQKGVAPQLCSGIACPMT